jgi:formylglycine-generating enzyme required for sulfatase activity
MGSVFKNEGSQDERPVHNVCLADFYIDRTEVTQSDYKNVMGSNPSSNRTCASCPVEQVTWHDAQKYCSQSGKRLPTEAEWEYAARGGGGKARFGNGADKISTSDANWDGTKFYEKFSFQGENRDKSVPVGSFAPNKLGITDMSGNVAEWVADWYDPGYYASSPQDNPKGPSGGDEKVIRGGGWFNNPDFLRTSKRFHLKPEYKNAWYGFRCAM